MQLGLPSRYHRKGCLQPSRTGERSYVAESKHPVHSQFGRDLGDMGLTNCQHADDPRLRFRSAAN